MISKPIDTQRLVHSEGEGDDLYEVDYPEGLVADLAKVAAHDRVRTLAFEDHAGEPFLVAYRALSHGEYDRLLAAGVAEETLELVSLQRRLAAQIVVWPTPDAFAAIGNAYYNLPGMVVTAAMSDVAAKQRRVGKGPRRSQRGR